MRILVISDIHANLTALEAVLNTAPDHEAVFCLGDLVDYGPDPNECIERIRSLPNMYCMLGNHDAAVLNQLNLDTFNYDARTSAIWTNKKLSPENLAFLKSLPEITEVSNIGGNPITPVTLVHGSPKNPLWEYILDLYTAAINFNYIDTDICITGHTHLAGMYQELDSETLKIEWTPLKPGTRVYINSRVILNPGSVGQPRDHDCRASFAIFDTDAMTWEPIRTEYDVASVQQRIEKSGLPMHHAERLAGGW